MQASHTQRMQAIITFLEEKSIDDLRMNISIGSSSCSGWVSRTNMSNEEFRRLKQAFGGYFDASGDPPYVYLRKTVVLCDEPRIDFAFEVIGAYECNVVSETEVETTISLSEQEQNEIAAQIVELHKQRRDGEKVVKTTKREYTCDPVVTGS